MRTNFQFQDQNITMVKGDTLAFNVQVFDEDNEPITVDSAFMTCKKMANASEFVFQKSLGGGISQADGLTFCWLGSQDRKGAILWPTC